MENPYLIFLLGAVLLAAALSDLMTKRISNFLTLGFIPVFLILIGLTQGFSAIYEHLLAGLLMGWIWGVGWGLGFFGGGDHKLLIAVGTAVGLSLIVPVSLAVAVVGGAQSLAAVWVDWLKDEGGSLNFRWRLKKIYVPYSVSIAIGTLAALAWRYFV